MLGKMYCTFVQCNYPRVYLYAVQCHPYYVVQPHRSRGPDLPIHRTQGLLISIPMFHFSGEDAVKILYVGGSDSNGAESDNILEYNDVTGEWMQGSGTFGLRSPRVAMTNVKGIAYNL